MTISEGGGSAAVRHEDIRVRVESTLVIGRRRSQLGVVGSLIKCDHVKAIMASSVRDL